MQYDIKQDDLWKGIIEDLFEDFLLYFYPVWAGNEVDFSKKFTFLDKELDEIYPTENGKKRFADKLVKVFLKSGKEKWILVHIEVQGYKDYNFPERMFTYFYRIRDRWRSDIISMAIFTDNDPNYHPKAYQYHFEHTKVLYEFYTFKLLDKKVEDLVLPNNPFSIVMLAARKSLEKQALTDKQQLIWKTELVKALKEVNYSENKIRRILNFIRYYVKFGKDDSFNLLEQNIQKTFKQRKNMGIDEIIIEGIKEQIREKIKEEVKKEVKEEVKKEVKEEVKKEVKEEVKKEVKEETKIKAIQKALQRKKLTLEEIAEDFEVTTDFVLRVQRGEI